MLYPFILTQGGSGGAPGYSLPTASSQGTRKDQHQIFKKVLEPSVPALKCVDAGTASGSYGTHLDAEQVWQASYDETNEAMRIVLVASSGGSASKLSYEEAIKDSFDPTMLAIRVVTGLDAKTISGKLDGKKVWQIAHDPTNHAIRGTVPAAGSGTSGSKLDMKQIWKKLLTSDGYITIVGEP